MRKKHVRNLTAGCAAFMAAAFVVSAGFPKQHLQMKQTKLPLYMEALTIHASTRQWMSTAK